ncbi:SDR family NAD(P)-dependent oxidoreductase [Streptomyces sp. NPDC058420]|uniref:SDR family NAD(P)-dependent oxidoreductase n=1 Tax=Streptomyces sp. NPDC058420 TaxID=3346489 RepID=UPI003656BA43
MAESLASTYGPWGVIAGGSDGVGAAFAHRLAAQGMNVVLVARRPPVLEASADEIRARHGVEVPTVALDLSSPGALAELDEATAGLEVGLFVYNAGQGGSCGGNLADPDDVAVEALAHLSDGPTWICGSPTPTGGSPFGALSRRDAVLAMSRGATSRSGR